MHQVYQRYLNSCVKAKMNFLSMRSSYEQVRREGCETAAALFEKYFLTLLLNSTPFHCLEIGEKTGKLNIYL